MQETVSRRRCHAVRGLPPSHHLSSDGVFATEVGEGHDASQFRRLVIHRGQLDERRQRSAVAKLLSALLLLVVGHENGTRLFI